MVFLKGRSSFDGQGGFSTASVCDEKQQKIHRLKWLVTSFFSKSWHWKHNPAFTASGDGVEP
jgi:hypothetical protein